MLLKNVPNDAQELYRRLPSVDEALRALETETDLSRPLLAAEIRRALDDARRAIGEGAEPKDVVSAVRAKLRELDRPSLRPVINAAGVILHTNLGRAPLSQAAVQAVARTAAGYANLEFDLAAGKRGRRDTHAQRWLERLLGARALVVNNCAAAIFLALKELGEGGEAIVSRGELVEIGDGFRIPEIMEASGCRLREVGATNRTSIADYERAFEPGKTRLILRVHPSNFRITGFTAQPSLDELVALGRRLGVPVVEDLGSGCLYDLARHGLEEEPLATAGLRAGVDLVCFSGDKLLGGPQAGILAGTAQMTERIRGNPLFRALRADKMIYAALEATLESFARERFDEIPTLRLLRTPLAEIRGRAENLARQLGDRAEVVEGESLLGGGSTPEQTLPTWLVRVSPPEGSTAARLERRLRSADPPVLVRIEDERLTIDLRTVFPEDDARVATTLASAITDE